METDICRGYKVLTHHLCSPLQGGEPLWDETDGTFPRVLPEASLDTSADVCAPGWNYSASISEALLMAGLWPTGRPSRVFEIQASADAIQREPNRRASQLTVLRECAEQEITTAIEVFSLGFAPHTTRMVEEQQQWRRALARPQRDAVRVEAALVEALRARGLRWRMQHFTTARDVIAARAAWDAMDARDARAARAAWDVWAARATWDVIAARAARAARAAWAARDVWAARAARDVWAARATWDLIAARAAWAAWDAWAARAAWAALSVCFTSLQGWIPTEAMAFTIGIRDAYTWGLEIALPVFPQTIGWAMKEE